MTETGSAVPDVSVIVAAYNSADFIDRALLSALDQTGIRCEILVADDASTDGTVAQVQSLAQDHPDIRVLVSSVNRGPSGARNCAFDEAAGAWFAILDSDDRFAPGRLARMRDIALSEGADIVIDDYAIATPDGTLLSDPILSARRRPGPIELEDWIALNLVYHKEISFGFAKPLISKDLINRLGLRYNEALRNGEDFHLILSALRAGARMFFSGEAGYHYTRRAGSVSNRSRSEDLAALLNADRSFSKTLSPADAQLHHLIDIRRRNIERLKTTEEVLAALKQKDLWAALGLILRHPAAAGRIASHLSEAVQKRILS